MIRGAEELYALSAALPELRPEVRRFYFLRHGETAGNATFIVQSPVIPLNEAGRAQAARAAKKLADAGEITRIEASSYPRAYETAQAAARRLAVPMNATPRLGERLFGELVGQSALELDWRAQPAGGETLPAFVARTKSAAAAALQGADISPASWRMAAICACSWPPSVRASATSSRPMPSRSASTARIPAGR